MNEKLRELRKALGLTMEKFGKKLGVGKTAISKIENGENSLTEQMFKAICNVNWDGKYVNEEWLRTGNGEMFKLESNKELEILLTERGLSHNDYLMVERFIELNDEKRAAILEYVLKVAEALQTAQIKNPIILSESTNLEELSDEEKIELYRRELKREREAKEKSEVS